METGNNLKDQLSQLDFTQNQVKVYEALIKYGESRAGDLIIKTGLHRNTVYEALQQLEKMHLLYVIMRKGVTHYRPTSARALVSEYQKKEEYAREIVREIEMTKVGSTDTEILVGDEGVEEYAKLFFGSENDVYVLGAVFILYTRYIDIYKKYEAERIQRKLRAFILAYPKYKAQSKGFNIGEIRYLPASFQESPLSVDVFGDTVAQFVWSDPAIIILLKNKSIAQAYRQYFMVLWEQAGV